MKLRTVFLSILLLGCGFAFYGCEPSARERPYGWHRLGNISEYAEAATQISSHWLYMRHNENGLSVMSTLCAHDLYPLEIKGAEEGQPFWYCDKCHSTFELDGRVKSGPAPRPLPYYSMRIDAAHYGAAPDTVYVEVGREVKPDWRLPLP